MGLWSLTEASLAGLAAGQHQAGHQTLTLKPATGLRATTQRHRAGPGAGAFPGDRPQLAVKGRGKTREGLLLHLAFLKSHFLSQFREAGVSVFKCLQLLFRSCESLVFSKDRTAIFSSGGDTVSSQSPSQN